MFSLMTFQLGAELDPKPLLISSTTAGVVQLEPLRYGACLMLAPFRVTGSPCWAAGQAAVFTNPFGKSVQNSSSVDWQCAGKPDGVVAVATRTVVQTGLAPVCWIVRTPT